MAQWLVKLDGNELDSNVLSKRFTEPDCQVTKNDDGAYYLTSDEFAAMTDSTDVHAAASDILLLIDDLMRVRDQRYQPISLDKVVRLNNDGTRVIIGQVSAQASIALIDSARAYDEITVTDADGQLIPSSEPSIAQARLKVAQQDPKVREALT